MADDESNADSGGESSSCSEGSNRIDLEAGSTEEAAAASIPQESEEETGTSGSDHENRTLIDSPSDQTQDLSCINQEPIPEAQDALTNNSSVISPSNQEQSITSADDAHDQSRRPIPRGPAARNLPPQCICFIRRLAQSDASQEFGKLYIYPHWAAKIHCCPRLPTEVLGAWRRAEFVAFDYHNAQYNMALVAYNREGSTRYFITGEWAKFLGAHDLKFGDVVFFYKTRDSMINDNQFYYVILFTRGDFIHPAQEHKRDDNSSAE